MVIKSQNLVNVVCERPLSPLLLCVGIISITYTGGIQGNPYSESRIPVIDTGFSLWAQGNPVFIIGNISLQCIVHNCPFLGIYVILTNKLGHRWWLLLMILGRKISLLLWWGWSWCSPTRWLLRLHAVTSWKLVFISRRLVSHDFCNCDTYYSI